jgi:hypothetical protein
MWKSKRKSQHGTQNVDTHNRTTQKTKKMSNTDPTNKPGVNSCAREGYAVPASYKTPVFRVVISVSISTCKRCSVRLYRQVSVGGSMSYLRYFSLLVSNTYCIVFLLCFSSSCVPYVASFSGLSLLDCSFDILVLAKGTQFLPLIRHPWWFSHIQYKLDMLRLPLLWFFYAILELFRQCDIFCFLFY